jgi:hypothetical protein
MQRVIVILFIVQKIRQLWHPNLLPFVYLQVIPNKPYYFLLSLG